MKKEYDFIFLTNTPSFYKVNLCNQIALSNSILLILYGYGSEAVNTSLTSSHQYNFDYVFIHEGVSNQRNKIKTFISLIQLMSTLTYKKILFSGWFVPEYNLYAFISPKQKNCLVCESSAKESHFSGIKGWIKKAIINRMSTALPSGELQKEIFDNICFKGHIQKTGGVGIFNKQPYVDEIKIKDHPKRYLYVGRLIDCKNLFFLINEFNQSGRSLTIVGKGYLKDKLQSIAKSNIHFIDFVPNDQLKDIYLQHDIFILPSKTETWGLVVDEALYYGLPVVVSNQVGSSIDLVTNLNTGLIFEIDNSDNFRKSIEEIEQNYEKYYNQVKKVDFQKRDIMQVKAYTCLLEN